MAAIAPVVALHDVVRTFDDVRAIDGLNLEITEGEVLGLLGHNGAGKTTAVRLVAGLLARTAGSVRVLGLDPVTHGDRVRRHLGVLPSTPPVDGRLTARQNLRFAADVFGVAREGLDERIAGLLATFQLTDRAGGRVATFSAGMRQRLALARVLLPDPQVLLLDEPSAALDPLAVRQVRQLLGELSRERSRTIVLCTHDLAEAQQLCDRVAVLDHGRAVALGSPSELAREISIGGAQLRVGVADVETARDLAGGFATDVEIAGRDTVRCRGVARDDFPELLRRLVAAGVGVYELTSLEPSLEDVYVALYARDKEGV